MKTNRILMTAALSMLLVGATHAQDKKELVSYSYIEAQGGLQLTSTDAKMDKLMLPTAAISFGHYFTPVVGARLHVNGWQAKSGFDTMGKYYKWKYITPDLDLMLNLTNLFSKCKSGSHPLNVILLGGIGLNYAWDNDELKDLGLHANVTPLAWDKNRLSHNLRAGLRLETNVTKPLGLSLELNANSLSDRFNSKTNDADDWQFTAMLGISYRFCHKYRTPKPRFIKKIIDVVDSVEVEEPYTIMVKEKRPKQRIEQKTVDKVIFFKNAGETDAEKAQGLNRAIREAAELMQTSDDAKITITGYADKGTGSAAGNKTFARKRAQDVADKFVNEYKFDKKRIKVDSKGDTVQPFPEDTNKENNKNRCVIVKGEGNFRVTYYEEVEVPKQEMRKVKKAVVRQVEIEEEVK
jgi:outer membrane protein OmpA-like peptidoglycan-associated protein